MDMIPEKMKQFLIKMQIKQLRDKGFWPEKVKDNLYKYICGIEDCKEGKYHLLTTITMEIKEGVGPQSEEAMEYHDLPRYKKLWFKLKLLFGT